MVGVYLRGWGTVCAQHTDESGEEVEETRHDVHVEEEPHKSADDRVLTSLLRVVMLRHVTIATLLRAKRSDDVSTVDAGADVAHEGTVGDFYEPDAIALGAHEEGTDE